MKYDIFFRVFFENFFYKMGFNSDTSDLLTDLSAIFILAVASYLLLILYKNVHKTILARVVNRTRSKYDNALIDKKFIKRTGYALVSLFVSYLIVFAIPDYEGWVNFIVNLSDILFIFFVNYSLYALIEAFHRTYVENMVEKIRPIKGYLQVLKIVTGFITGILIVAILINKSPAYLIGGLSAMTAVLLLVFKDTILGFVASVQLSTNNMLRPGDWITMDKYNADGDVLEISLTSVKVKNFDNTIVTIPTYSMISEGFQNWRGMQESEGRRIKRSICVDINSIRFLTADEIESLKKIDIIKKYIEDKQSEIKDFNDKIYNTDLQIVNGRNQTNIGVFRAYLEAYLRNYPSINHGLTLMVRQLPASEKGLPLELYCFSASKDWVEYENVIADIFDHVLASYKYFGLHVFQLPSGTDIKEIKK